MLERTAMAMNAANLNGFRQGLRERGYVDGESVVIEYRSADGRDERFPGRRRRTGTRRRWLWRSIHEPLIGCLSMIRMKPSRHMLARSSLPAMRSDDICSGFRSSAGSV